MRIEQSQVVQHSKTTYSEKSVKEEKLNAWVDNGSNGQQNGAQNSLQSKKGVLLDLLNLSANGLELSQSSSSTKLQGIEATKEEDLLSKEDELKMKLIEEMLIRFTGKKFKFRHVLLKLTADDKALAQLNQNMPQLQKGQSIRFVAREATQETAQVIAQSASAIQSKMVVKNADGSIQAAVQSGQTQTYDATAVQVNTRSAELTRGDGGVGWGLNYSERSEYLEQEKMSFKSTGTVKLADGREMAFDYSMNMSRSYYESHEFSFKAGDALKDPLVINMDGMGAALTDKTMHFDIDFNGDKEDIPVLAKGNGYLVFDRNENGTLDNGSELFGTKTGKGFDELRAFDSDQNGWIDENDAIFKNLKVWVSDGEGSGKLLGLVAADVGAIYLGDVSTQFHMKDAQNSTLGLVKNSSVYLKESGKAASISEIDLKI